MHPVVFASGHQLQTEDICFVLLIQQAELVKVPRKIINLKYEYYSYIGIIRWWKRHDTCIRHV